MKNLFLIILICPILISCANKNTTAPPISLIWEMGQNGIEPGYFESTFYIKNTGKETLTGNWTIYYTQISVPPPLVQEDSPIMIKQISASYNQLIPTKHFQPLAPGETLTFTYRQKGSIIRETGAPQGAYIVMTDKNGKEQKPQDIPLEALPFNQEYQYKRPGKNYPYADGTYMYKQNAYFNKNTELELTDIFPSVKQLEKKTGESNFTPDVNLRWEPEFKNEATLLKNDLSADFNCTFSDTGKTIIELTQLTDRNKDYPDEYYRSEERRVGKECRSRWSPYH